MNEDKELEEARNRLMRDIKKPLACGSICVVSISDVETILQTLKNSIPTKKIEDKYKDMKKQYEEELEKNSIKAFILKCKIQILEEVLENK